MDTKGFPIIQAMMFAHKDKLKAFNAGAMNIAKQYSKDNKKKKEIEEEEARAAVYKEFVDSFNESGNKTRAWVKGGVVNPGSSSTGGGSGNRLYKPSVSRAPPSSNASPQPALTSTPSSNSFPNTGKLLHAQKKSGKSEKRSNLESFKEELKIMQEQRDHRHAMKNYLKELQESQNSDKPRKSRFEPVPPPLPPSLARGVAPPMDLDYPMDFDTDKSTTNIFLGNLNPVMSEQRLMEVFGRYGPLASIKIMWPRNDDERSRGRNCGFVAFMHRKDAERAMTMLRGRDVYNYEMKMGWGKGVPIPVQPVYVPPRLMQLVKPPPPSGLPFNAQPKEWLENQQDRSRNRRMEENPRPMDVSSLSDDEFKKTVKEAVVKVVIPTERPLLALINRMVEFVVREGPVFEAIIMNREMHNPQFNFLFDYQTPEHIYYRWKLFSILNGDAANTWRADDFRMFDSGSMWRPPPMNVFTSGMPDELVDDDGMDIIDDQKTPDRSPKEQNRPKKPAGDESGDEASNVRRTGVLSERQRDHLEKQLKELTPERSKIGEMMVWCLNHADCAKEICESIGDHLSVMNTPLDKKLARLYLISDILYNCGKVPKTSLFRRCFEERLEDIFHDMCEYHQNLDGRLKSEQFKQKVMLCFRVWEDWSIYTNEFLIRLQNTFLGLKTNSMAPNTSSAMDQVEIVSMLRKGTARSGNELDGEALDGRPLVDYDGDPLDGLPLNESPSPPSEKRKRLDGHEPDSRSKRRRRESGGSGERPSGLSASRGSQGSRGGFLASKWETVDPEVVQAQAVTTSKWDLFEEQEPDAGTDLDGRELDENDFDGEPLSASMSANPISLVSYDDDDEEEDVGEEAESRLHRSNRHHEEMEEGEEAEEGEDTSSLNSSQEMSGGPSSIVVTPSQQHQLQLQAGMSEERRAKLREIELKVVKYQDEVESGKRSRKSDMSLHEQVEAYRRKLVQREMRHSERHHHKRRRGGSQHGSEYRSRRRSRSRSRSRGGSGSGRRGAPSSIDGRGDRESESKRTSGSSSKRAGNEERSSRTSRNRSRRSRSRSPRDRTRERDRDSKRTDRHSRR